MNTGFLTKFPKTYQQKYQQNSSLGRFPAWSDLKSDQAEPPRQVHAGAQHVIDARLPAIARCAQRGQQISVKARLHRLSVFVLPPCCFEVEHVEQVEHSAFMRVAAVPPCSTTGERWNRTIQKWSGMNSKVCDYLWTLINKGIQYTYLLLFHRSTCSTEKYKLRAQTVFVTKRFMRWSLAHSWRLNTFFPMELAACATNEPLPPQANTPQTRLLAADDRRHAVELLRLMCGTDEMARLLVGFGPGMRFVSISTEAHQVNLATRQFRSVAGNCNGMALADKSMDAVVVVHVGCHLADWRPMLTECWRVLKPDGVVLMCEPVNAGSADLSLWRSLGVILRTPTEMVATFGDCSFQLDWVHEVQEASPSEHPESPATAALWRGAASVVMRLAKQDLLGRGH